jgi:hypothetical protein
MRSSSDFGNSSLLNFVLQFSDWERFPDQTIVANGSRIS